MKFSIFAIALSLISSVTTFADEKLAGIACRSVHLGYQTGPAKAFAIEVTPKVSAEGTYFCAIGFSGGYFGIQETASKKKLVIFSVWDPTKGDDKNAVPAEKRVTLLFKDEKVRTGRFGGEGTGGQSFFDYDWKLDTKYRFLVESGPDPKDDTRTAYTGFFYEPDLMAWRKLVTFSTIKKEKAMSGFYSFVEDFRRNKISATQQRMAEYGPAWVRDEQNEWKVVTKARFTADSNPAMTIDAGPTTAGDRWFLATGGKTENKTPLKTVMALPKPVTSFDGPQP